MQVKTTQNDKVNLTLDSTGKLCTLAIMTYNRPDAINFNVEHLQKNNISELVNIVIQDNASNGGYFYDLMKREYPNNFILRRNEKNIGANGNYIKLIEECETKYIILCSDEDIVDYEKLKLLGELLANSSPSFVSPIFIDNSRIVRGKKQVDKIRVEEYQYAAGAISGLVFDAQVAKSCIKKFGYIMLDEAQQWPHVLILIWMMMCEERECYWFPHTLVNQVYDYPDGGFQVRTDGFLDVMKHYVSTLDFIISINNEVLPQNRKKYSLLLKKPKLTQSNGLN